MIRKADLLAENQWLRRYIGLLEVSGQRQQMPLSATLALRPIGEIDQESALAGDILAKLEKADITLLADLVACDQEVLSGILTPEEVNNVQRFLGGQQLYFLGKDPGREFPDELLG
ncbi:MAG: hypothetical protein AAB499_00505 [Patescibacteria group bacterium]